ncbi:MAG: hypothetical protein IJZ34_10990 [Lachnospiraceae bacterium]|nr:hypothetical protein [Lachnospiraceae bacterium]
MSDYLSELYPEALDAGISHEVFWDSSLREIHDMLESFLRRRKQKLKDDFIIAEVTALNILIRISPKKNKKYPKPWDYYECLFSEEKKIYEEEEEQQAFEEYKEQRRRYVEEYNRRRQQGKS